MKLKTRILSLMLAAVICLGMLPGQVLAAGGEAFSGMVRMAAATNVPSSNSATLSVPLLNKEMVNDRTILNEYVNKDNGLLNGGGRFSLYDWNSVNMAKPPEKLSDAYSHYFQRINNDSTWRARYKWSFNSADSTFLDLVQEGQISYRFSAELKYDRHTKLGKHAHTRTRDFAVVRFYSVYESNQYFELINNKDQDEESWIPMSAGWSQLPASTKGDLRFFFWHDEGDRCWDGASGVRKAAVAFADTVSPYVTSVKVDNTEYYYNSGSFKFTVYFNEPIRLADGGSSINNGGNNARVRLAAYDRDTLASREIYAMLTGIGEDSLTFTYEVPEDDIDVIITGLADRDYQIAALLTPDQTLKMYDVNGGWSEIKSNGKTMTVDATFTDLAGNGINESWRGVSFPREIHVDTIKPTYNNTVIESGSMLRDQDQEKLTDDWNRTEATVDGWKESGIDRSQVFAGVGDWINLAVDFNEELRTFSGTGAAYGPKDARYFTATLNVKDKNGDPVTIKGSTIFSMQDNVNSNRLRSRLRFETLAITEDMTPVEGDRPSPIRIESLALTDGKGTTVYDMCGNELSLSGIGFVDPDKQEWLDTVAPTVQMILDSNTEHYTDAGDVQTYKDGGVKISLQVLENTYGDDVDLANKLLYKSGTAGVGTTDGEMTQDPGTVTFSGADGAILECAVTGTDTVPTAWTTVYGNGSVNFAQLDGPSYLHLRMSPDSEVPVLGDLTVTATGYDYAGNAGTVKEQPITGVNLKEHTLPKSTAAFSSKLDSSGTKTVTADFTVSDLGGLTEVWYKLENHNVDASDRDEKPVEVKDIGTPTTGSGWTKVSLTDNPLSVNTITEKPIKVESLQNNFVYLSIYAVDRSGNVYKEVHTFQEDMRMPGFTVTVPEEITDFDDPAQKITISQLSIDDAKNINKPVSVWDMSYDPSGGTDEGQWLWEYGTLFVTVQTEQNNSSRMLTKMVDWLVDKNQGDQTSKPTAGKADPARDETAFPGIDDLIDDLKVGYGAIQASGVETPYKGAKYSSGWRGFSNGVIISKIKSGLDFDYTKDAQNMFEGEPVESERNDWARQYNLKENGYYGNLNIYVTESTSQRLDGASIQLYQNTNEYTPEPNAKPVFFNKYTVKVKTDDGNTESNPINTVKFHPPVAANGQALATEGEKGAFSDLDKRITPYVKAYDPETDAPIAFTTLDGVTIPFTVTNNRVPEWGIEDIDFNGSKIKVYWAPFVTDGLQADEYVFQGEFPLKEDSAEQSFIFPQTINDQPYKTGVYKIVVELKTKSFENNFSIYDCSTDTEQNGFVFRVCAMSPTEEGGSIPPILPIRNLFRIIPASVVLCKRRNIKPAVLTEPRSVHIRFLLLRVLMLQM